MTELRAQKAVVVRNRCSRGASKYLLQYALTAAVLISTSSGPLAQAHAAGLSVPEPAVGVDAEYRLSVGDVIQISVRGFPDLRQQSVVELNGEVSLPLAGRVRVVGMTIAEAQGAIRKLVTDRPLGQRSSDGRETFTVIAAHDVNISIAEYRPVYVLGDVAKPGELSFRPGLTVRQAIALAGGFDVMRYRLINPFTESAEMKSQHETLLTELTKVRARISRVRAELDGRSELDRTELNEIPLGTAFIDQVFETEAEIFKRRRSEFVKEKELAKQVIQQTEDKVKTLTAVLENEEEGFNNDKQEYAKLLELNKQGTITLARLMDARRVGSASETRLLQARVQLDQAIRERSEAVRKSERLENTRRTELLDELQHANVEANSLQARLSANAEKLVHTSLLKSRLVRGPGAKPTILVHRATRNTRQTINGNEDTPLLPGDTIEVSLKSEFDIENDRGQYAARAAKSSDRFLHP
jgi:polysaccharide export outer membrane protein